MKQIETREDIKLLVVTFYSRVREDKLLGPFFNAVFPTNESWEPHYDLLIHFWEMNLFNKSGFTGDPVQRHQQVDKQFHHSMTANHFNRWADIWAATVDEFFEGSIAELAKQKARRMAIGMYKKVLDKRPGGFIMPGQDIRLSD